MKWQHVVLPILILVSTLAVGQESKYLIYDNDLIPPDEYQRRRQAFMQSIEPEAVAIFYSAPERRRNNTLRYQYRQDDNFYYLTGFDEPNAILVLTPSGVPISVLGDTSRRRVTEILFVMKKDPHREMWEGRLFGPEAAMELLKIEYAATNDKFKSAAPFFAMRYEKVYLPTFREDFSGEIKHLLLPLHETLDDARNRIEIKDPTSIVNKMRAVKSPEELRLIRRATEISVVAHRQAMTSCKPGMYEYELYAIYEYVFRKLGAEFSAYPCIVGAAENSVILHYRTSRKQMKDGEIVLADCGAEYHNYATDITRTFPVNGKFSKPQQEIYELVLKAQEEAMKEIKPGVPFSNASRRADQVLMEGMLQLGIIQDTSQFKRFYPHRLGHPVGLNVHDVSLPVLQPGMVYTVEPGVYIPENSPGVDPKYYNIGVRIEDVVLVTEDGYELLSKGLPRTVKEIEELMKKEGIGNQPLN